jgi:hypothetical protein
MKGGLWEPISGMELECSSSTVMARGDRSLRPPS